MKEQKGITLIVLIITVIILMILTAVTIDIAIDGRLFDKAEDTVNQANQQRTQTQENTDNLLQEWNTGDSGVRSETNLGNEPRVHIEPENIDDWIWTLDEETNTITIIGYKGTNTEVIVPNYIGGVPVKQVGSKNERGTGITIWDESILSDNIVLYGVTQETITKLIISPGIEVIEDRCFVGAINLQELSIPNTVKKIGSKAFYACYSLEKVTIPASVMEIGRYAFEDCKALQTITIAEGVTKIDDYAFYDCSKLTSFTIAFSESVDALLISNDASKFNKSTGFPFLVFPFQTNFGLLLFI